jgi:hypothetical protein
MGCANGLNFVNTFSRCNLRGGAEISADFTATCFKELWQITAHNWRNRARLFGGLSATALLTYNGA